MKRIVLLAALFLVTLSPVWAHEEGIAQKQKTDSKEAGYIGFGMGADLPGSNWYSGYFLGGGGELLGGYRFDPNWSVQGKVQNWFYEANIASQFNCRALAELKYSFPMEGCQPYLLVGGGTVFLLTNPGNASAFNLDGIAGIGLQVDLSKDVQWYVEAQYNFILPATGSFQDIPLTTGILTYF